MPKVYNNSHLKKDEKKGSKSVKKKSGLSVLGGKDPIPWQLAKLVCIECSKNNKTIALLFAVGFYSGLRFSDLIKVNKTNILRHSFSIKSKKTGKMESRPFPKGFYNLLKQCNIVITALPNNNLFPAEMDHNKIVSSQVVGLALKKYCALVGVSEKCDVATHTMRKTYARRLYDISDNKANVLVFIMQMFGHTDTATTLRYIGITKEEINDLIMSIDDEPRQESEKNIILKQLIDGFSQLSARIDELNSK